MIEKVVVDEISHIGFIVIRSLFRKPSGGLFSPPEMEYFTDHSNARKVSEIRDLVWKPALGMRC